MSRVGKNPITIPSGVSVEIKDNLVTVKGVLGTLSQDFSDVDVKIEDGVLTVTRRSEDKTIKAKHGLYRSLINNMIVGVSNGFKNELELVGVGYRASNQEQRLELSLGYSHNIVIEICPEVKVETLTEKGKNPIIKLSSFDKQLLGQVTAKIRDYRRPEPYKGKGVKFVGEVLRIKAGKTA